MSGFVEDLTAAPPLSPLSRYTVANGVLYMVIGVLFVVVPAQWLAFGLMLDGFHGHEEGWARMMGFVLVIVGWFYVMGGRTGATSFALATVVDRALVPFMFGSLYLLDKVALGMVLPVAILDPVLALGAFLIWRSQRA
ncbi:MAG: hypothetical protein EP330_13085 [Deltaproteobacteria bacterium]|nr:MAG: hypothetical protein EP330_13085 [Deltaproteobacteria bacterium]